jgi:tRNA threonylcarbamoyladenosine biosynthesis protein TsaB
VIVLGIDTSGKQGGIALGRAEGDKFTLIAESPIEGGTFSSQLIPQTAELLQKHKLKKEDIGGFAAASGPGSFTGLRVGLAAVKAFAEILGKPIAAVSVLEALAFAARKEGKITAVLDAQRQEVFLSEYEVSAGRGHMLCEELMTLAHFLAGAKQAAPDQQLVTCDDSVAAALREIGAKFSKVPRPTAADIARIGASKLARGETVSVEQLDANYIRRSDAEIFAKPAK